MRQRRYRPAPRQSPAKNYKAIKNTDEKAPPLAVEGFKYGSFWKRSGCDSGAVFLKGLQKRDRHML